MLSHSHSFAYAHICSFTGGSIRLYRLASIFVHLLFDVNMYWIKKWFYLFDDDDCLIDCKSDSQTQFSAINSSLFIFSICVLSSASFHWCTQRCYRACAAFRANWSTKECVRETSGYGLWICCLVGSTRLRIGYITVGFVRLFSCVPQMRLNLPLIFRVYVVRWYVEPGHHLMGTGETRETYYRGL